MLIKRRDRRNPRREGRKDKKGAQLSKKGEPLNDPRNSGDREKKRSGRIGDSIVGPKNYRKGRCRNQGRANARKEKKVALREPDCLRAQKNKLHREEQKKGPPRIGGCNLISDTATKTQLPGPRVLSPLTKRGKWKPLRTT